MGLGEKNVLLSYSSIHARIWVYTQTHSVLLVHTYAVSSPRLS